jgi:hypothetical protein
MRAAACAVLLASASASFGQATEADIHKRDKPADAAELDAITSRGRAIAAYDQVAWHATDAVLAIPGAKNAIGMYIGRQTAAGWIVAFGKLNEKKDAFLLAYEAQPTGDVLHPRVIVHTPPLEDRGEWSNEARAYELARSAFGSRDVAYNGTVLFAPNDEWYVYFYPAQTIDGVFPTGADTRFRVSHDGLAIKETHKMHVSLLENDFRGKDGKKTAMSFHTAILDDAPEDTDVANVLMEGGTPMMIAGRNFVYKVSADGTIAFVMKTKDLPKTNK